MPYDPRQFTHPGQNFNNQAFGQRADPRIYKGAVPSRNGAPARSNTRRSGGGSFAQPSRSIRSIEGGQGYSAPSMVDNSPVGQSDPLADFIQKMMTYLGDDGSGSSSVDINGAFSPRYAALDAAGADLDRRYQRGNTEIGAMYDALSKGINSREGEVASNFDNAIAQTGQINAGTIAGMSDRQAQINAQQEAMLRRLGIEQAAPTMDESAKSTQLMQDAVAANDAAQRSALTGNRATSVDFNKTQANIAGLEGRNRQSDLLSQLMSAQSDLAGQRANIDADRAQASLSMRQSGNNNRQDNLKWALGLGLDQMNAADKADQPEPSSWARTYKTALDSLGAVGAERAMGVIMSASADGMGNTQGEWINKAVNAARGSGVPDQMIAAIASTFWDSADPRAPQPDLSLRP